MHLISVDVEIETNAYYSLEEFYLHKYTFLIILQTEYYELNNQAIDVDHIHKPRNCGNEAIVIVYFHTTQKSQQSH